MALIEKTVVEFANEVDSSSPAPGGGSVSALAGVIGASLARMVGHITVNKKAYKKLDAREQEQFEQALARLLAIKDELLPLIDEDTNAFNAIMAAYKLPKNTEQEKQVRIQAIEDATKGAIEVPMQVANLSLEALKLLKPIEDFGNKNARSDVGVAALQLGAATQGALMNVKINLPGLSDEEEKKTYLDTVEEMFEKASLFTNFIANKVFELL